MYGVLQEITKRKNVFEQKISFVVSSSFTSFDKNFFKHLFDNLITFIDKIRIINSDN